MLQRTTLIISAILTAFVLVIVGGLASNLTRADATSSTPAVEITTAPSVASDTSTTSATPAQAAPVNTATYAVALEEAVALALEQAQDAALLQMPELVNFQGTAAYEVVLDQGTVYVDATTGAILHNGIVPVTASAPALNSNSVSGEHSEYERSEHGERGEREVYEDD